MKRQVLLSMYQPCRAEVATYLDLDQARGLRINILEEAEIQP